jgi:hypothetical protein
VKRSLLLFVLVAACSSGKPKQPEPAPTPVEKVATPDPWDVPAAPTTGTGTGTKNLNKLVIGGDNRKPQMGLFALAPADAAKVDAAMKDGLEGAYRLAQKLSVKAWAGDRNFCEDAVRMTIGYFGIDGMMDASALRRWKTAKLADVRAQHAAEINKLHFEMIGERDEAACDKTLALYVEGLKLAATDKLELRNFGF